MRIRKHAKISPLIYAASSLQPATLVCQLNQSPWDVISFPIEENQDPQTPLSSFSYQVSPLINLSFFLLILFSFPDLWIPISFLFLFMKMECPFIFPLYLCGLGFSWKLSLGFTKNLNPTIFYRVFRLHYSISFMGFLCFSLLSTAQLLFF